MLSVCFKIIMIQQPVKFVYLTHAHLFSFSLFKVPFLRRLLIKVIFIMYVKCAHTVLECVNHRIISFVTQHWQRPLKHQSLDLYIEHKSISRWVSLSLLLSNWLVTSLLKHGPYVLAPVTPGQWLLMCIVLFPPVLLQWPACNYQRALIFAYTHHRSAINPPCRFNRTSVGYYTLVVHY